MPANFEQFVNPYRDSSSLKIQMDSPQELRFSYQPPGTYVERNYTDVMVTGLPKLYKGLDNARVYTTNPASMGGVLLSEVPVYPEWVPLFILGTRAYGGIKNTSGRVLKVRVETSDRRLPTKIIGKFIDLVATNESYRLGKNQTIRVDYDLLPGLQYVLPLSETNGKYIFDHRYKFTASSSYIVSPNFETIFFYILQPLDVLVLIDMGNNYPDGQKRDNSQRANAPRTTGVSDYDAYYADELFGKVTIVPVDYSERMNRVGDHPIIARGISFANKFANHASRCNVDINGTFNNRILSRGGCELGGVSGTQFIFASYMSK